MPEFLKESLENEDAMLNTADKGVYEIAMDKYIKEQSKPSFLSMTMIMRPCFIIVVMTLVMFIIFLITQSYGFADMKVTQLEDFIDQDSDSANIY